MYKSLLSLLSNLMLPCCIEVLNKCYIYIYMCVCVCVYIYIYLELFMGNNILKRI